MLEGERLELDRRYSTPTQPGRSAHGQLLRRTEGWSSPQALEVLCENLSDLKEGGGDP